MNLKTFYMITATVLYPADKNGYRSTRQIPTFYLNADIQGIRSEQDAENIACRILGGYNEENKLVHAVAVKQEIAYASD